MEYMEGSGSVLPFSSNEKPPPYGWGHRDWLCRSRMGMAKGRSGFSCHSLHSIAKSCAHNVEAKEDAASGLSELIIRMTQISTIQVAPLWGAFSKPHAMRADSLRRALLKDAGKATDLRALNTL